MGEVQMQLKFLKSLEWWLILVAMVLCIAGCASSKKVLKVKSDSISVVKSKLHLDSNTIHKSNTVSISFLNKHTSTLTFDEKIDVFYNKPDSTGKQSINHKTIYRHQEKSKTDNETGSTVSKSTSDSSHINKDLTIASKTQVNKHISSTTTLDTGFHLGWKGILSCVVLVIIAGVVIWWKFFM